MKLKRLEIIGFKSFPEKTTIDFCDGITSVVGPNGSGKSNIMEAVRWVMGEQRTRTLRCKKMEDLIFNGSDSLKPVGMAEVRLTLGNDGKSFPPPMSDYDEIMVTRRVYRDGNSQYEFNGISCRLADIVEFFLDTGIGRNSYAIIEQGRVEQIIAARPEERRIFLEEAASINRYKLRRESTIRKLEQTNQNLQRIKDVISEVKKQSQSLKKQASKAERFRELKHQLRNLEISLEAFKCRNLSGKLNQLKVDEKELVDELAHKEAKLAKLTAELEFLRLQTSDIQASFRALAEKLHSTEAERNACESNLNNCLSRENELRQRRRRIKSDLDSGIRNKSGAEIRMNEYELKRSEFISTQTKLTEDLESSQLLTISLEKETKEENIRLEQFKEQLFEILQKISQNNNKTEQNSRRQTEIRARLKKHEADLMSQSESLDKSLQQMDHIHQRTLEVQQSLNLVESEIGTDQEKRSALASEIKSSRENFRLLENEFLSVKARLEFLNDQNRNYSSYSAGTRSVMKAFSSFSNTEPLEPLAELVQCPPEYHLALASALDSRLGAIVVKDFSHALELAEKIKQRQVSRVDLLPLGSFSSDSCDYLLKENHYIKRLSDVVTASPHCKGLVNELLKDFYVVETLALAKEWLPGFGPGIKIVTLDGEIIVPERLVSVGTLETMERDILSKKLEAETLDLKASEAEKQIQITYSNIENQESLRQGLSNKIEKNTLLKSELKIEQVRLLKDIERLNSENSRLRSAIRSIDLNKKRILEDLSQLTKENDELEINSKFLEEKRCLLTQKKEAFEKHTKEARSSLDKETKRMNELRISLVQIEERKKSLEKELNSTKNFIKNCERQNKNFEQEIQYLTQQAQHLAQDKTKTINHKKQLSILFDTLSVEQAKTQKSYDSLKLVAVKLSDEEQRLNKSVGQLRERMHENEVEMVRLQEALRNSVEKIVEKHNVDPRFANCPLAQPDEGELVEIRSKLESMGEVNLAAISESQQVEARFGFLLEQEKDLVAAVKSLFATVDKIDRTTTQRFHSTFQEVNVKFREIFSSLFNGGEAWLELIGSGDPANYGVNIMVKPPGKRLQNVDLLSGGEKALTAIAFIFAIFLYKPSSFCLLDEVDAPLDDSNVDRFNQMLRDLSRNTQFVVITHNKKSMEGSDCLFGVTSGKAGASTLVSVKLAD